MRDEGKGIKVEERGMRDERRRINRFRSIIGCSMFVVAAAVHAQPAPGGAQSYPTKTVRVIVGFAPGGSTDVTARIVAQKMSEAWRQQVIVDNRPGAGGNIGAELV